MKMQVLSIRDRCADLWSAPSFVASVPVALRNLTDEINQPGNQSALARHPEDYELFLLGTFDDGIGRFELLPHPKSIAVIQSLIVKAPAPAAQIDLIEAIGNANHAAASS